MNGFWLIKKAHKTNQTCDKNNNKNLNNLPRASSSGDTRFVKSGSSPYQNIHNSLAECKDNGGLTGPEGCGNNWSNKTALLCGCCDAPTRLHTHKISPAKHREKLDSTGSSIGSGENPSPHTSLRHLMPHKSVCKQKKKYKLNKIHSYTLFSSPNTQ